MNKNATTKKSDKQILNNLGHFILPAPYDSPEKSFKSFSPPPSPLQEAFQLKDHAEEKASGRGSPNQRYLAGTHCHTQYDTLYPDATIITNRFRSPARTAG